MNIITTIFSNNQRYPVLINENGIPYLLPLTFSITQLSYKSFSTKKRYIGVIKQLYTFCLNKNLDFENLVLNQKTEMEFLDEFILSSLLYSKPESFEALEKYVLWLSQRFKTDDTLRVSLERKLNLLHAKRPKTERMNYKSLSDIEIKEIREIIQLNKSNPFKIDLQFRNWLIVELLLQSGLRIGELLKLKVNDFMRHEDRFYMKVDNYKGDVEDVRKIEPSNKNIRSFRTVALTKELFELINKYILNYRRPLKGGKKMKLPHSYLFVSERGMPLSIRASQVIFQIIQREIRLKGREISLSPHVLRHTFVDHFLQFLIEIQRLDMDRAKDELKSICGWTTTSSMPLRYAGRQINSMANFHNIQRIENRKANDI